MISPARISRRSAALGKSRAGGPAHGPRGAAGGPGQPSGRSTPRAPGPPRRRPCRAGSCGRPAWECHFLTGSPGDFHRLLRLGALFLGEARGKGRALRSAFLPQRPGRDSGAGRGAAARGPAETARGAAVGPPPWPAVVPSGGFGRAKHKHPVSLSPALTPSSFFFSLSYKS